MAAGPRHASLKRNTSSSGLAPGANDRATPSTPAKVGFDVGVGRAVGATDRVGLPPHAPTGIDLDHVTVRLHYGAPSAMCAVSTTLAAGPMGVRNAMPAEAVAGSDNPRPATAQNLNELPW